MADLKLLVERVIEKEKDALQKEINQVTEEAERKLEQKKQEAEAEKETRKNQIDSQLKQEYEIKQNTLTVQQRNQTLAAKQRILDQVFSDAADILHTLDQPTTQTFLENIFQQFEGQGEMELVLGERTKEKMNQDWLQNLSVEGTTIVVSDETIPNQSGAILKKQGIEYNFLFDDLLEDIRNDVIQPVSNQLFK